MIPKLPGWMLLLSLLAGVGFLPADDKPLHRLVDPSAVDHVIQGFVTSGAFPFVYVRLEDRNGNMFYEHAAVNDELMGEMRVDADSWIRIWSMSKIVTISIALDLVEEGVLALDDPVTRYIPEFAGLEVATSSQGDDLSRMDTPDKACPYELVPVKQAMTVLDLINHKAGFFYPTTGKPCLDEKVASANLPAAANSQDLVRRMATLPLINQPGANSFYGTGTTVLGLVIERASRSSLKDLVENRVTGPMGIYGLQYGLPAQAELPPRFSGRDGQVREALPDELDIFGSQLPDYDPAHQLYLGGEGMVGTADGYADFARMLLRRGELNGYRFLDEATVEDIIAPHTQLDNPFGHNGYNLWISNGKTPDGGQGPAPLWIGGGYEGTHFWIDPTREFVGVVMSQIFWVPQAGYGRDEAIRRAIYAQWEKAAEE